MKDYKELLLSITKYADEKKNAPVISEIKTVPRRKEKSFEELETGEVEKKFYQELVKIFVPSKKMEQIIINGNKYLDISDKDFKIRSPFNISTWVIMKNSRFVFRITMRAKNLYRFKVGAKTFEKINFSNEETELLKKRLSVNDYVEFSLSYDQSISIAENFKNIDDRKRNNILEEWLKERGLESKYKKMTDSE